MFYPVLVAREVAKLKNRSRKAGIGIDVFGEVSLLELGAGQSIITTQRSVWENAEVEKQKTENGKRY